MKLIALITICKKKTSIVIIVANNIVTDLLRNFIFSATFKTLTSLTFTRPLNCTNTKYILKYFYFVIK